MKEDTNIRGREIKQRFVGQIILNKPIKERMDLKDRKILYLLCKNARFSDTTIARALKIKREVVSYRIKRMLEKDILHGFLTLINPRRLGFHIHVLYIKLREFYDEKELIDYLYKFDEVTRLKNCNGNYDLQVVLTTKNLEDFDNMFKKIFDPIADNIQDYIILELIEENFLGLDKTFLDIKDDLNITELKGSSFEKYFQKPIKNEIIKLDDKDKRLLELLKLNCRINLIELSRNLNLYISTINNKIKYLIGEGVIKKFMPLASLSHLDYQWYKVFFKVKNLDEKRFIAFLKQNSNVLWYMKFVGKWNYQFSIFAKDNNNFNKILNQIRTEFKENIISYDSIVVFNQFKFVHRLE